MAFKKPTINKASNNINKLRIYIRAVRKWGKTTLFRDYIEELYDGDASKGLLVGVGYEHGYDMLDNLNALHVDTWKDLTELKKWLITEKGKEHNIEIVAFDVVDELIPIAEKEAMRLSEIKTQKKCTSINESFGGFGRGQEKVKELIKKYFAELRSAGFGTWAIAHTKDKTIKEKGMNDDEGYQVLTSNLSNSYESIFGDIFDCVLTGYVDKTVKDGRITSSVRKLALRGDYYVEAGCRFANNSIPEYIECCEDSKDTAKLLIKTLKDGLKGSKSKPMSDEEFEALAKKEMKEFAEQKVEVKEEIDRDLLLGLIKKNIKNQEVVTKIKELMGSEGVSAVGELSDEALNDISKLI